MINVMKLTPALTLIMATLLTITVASSAQAGP